MNTQLVQDSKVTLIESIKAFQTFDDYTQLKKKVLKHSEDFKYSLEELTQIAVRLSEDIGSGPFGALLAKKHSNQAYEVLSIGANLVTANNNSILHAETVAVINYFQQNSTKFSLEEDIVLVTSCEPCTQCRSIFLAAGGKQDNIIAVLSSQEACSYGGFADASFYDKCLCKLADRPILKSALKQESKCEICFKDNHHQKVSYDINTGSFVSSFLSNYYAYTTTTADVSYENGTSSVIINHLPSYLAQQEFMPFLRVFFSVLDWSKLSLEVQNFDNKSLFDSIQLFSRQEIATVQFIQTYKKNALAIMQEWKINTINTKKNYGQK